MSHEGGVFRPADPSVDDDAPFVRVHDNDVIRTCDSGDYRLNPEPAYRGLYHEATSEVFSVRSLMGPASVVSQR